MTGAVSAASAQRLSAAAAPRFEPVRTTPPRHWPSLWTWVSASRRNALQLFPEACYREPFVEHTILGQRLIVLNDLASIQGVLGAGSRNFRLTNMHLRMLTPALRDGVIVAQGEAWRRSRRESIRLLDVGDAMTATSARLIDDAVADWAQVDGASVSEGATRLAIGLLAAELFGYDGAAADSALLADLGAHRALMEKVDLLDVIGAPAWLATGRMRRAKRLVAPYYARIDRAIAESTVFTPPKGFAAEAVQDLVVNLMVGYESLAASMIWFLGLMAEAPALVEWLTAPASPEECERRRNLAILETLRLYPPLPLIFRQALCDQDTAVGRIPKGAIVCISPYILHRNAENFSEPDHFIADRFAGVDLRKAPFLSFGLGARQCPGHQLAPRLLSRTVGRLLATVRPVPGAGVLSEPRAGISLRPTRDPSFAFAAR